MKAFISYSTADKVWAAHTKACLDSLEIESFMAHEDLVVSEDWKTRIMEELKAADMLLCLLSKDFKSSDWCPQELGFIAARPETVIIPLSIDGTVSFGFISHLQSQTVKLPIALEIEGLIVNALLRRNFDMAISLSVKRMLRVKGYRVAEDITRRLIPFSPQLSPEQAEAIANAAIKNPVVWDAGGCATQILPIFLGVCGDKIPAATVKALRFQITERTHYRE